MMKCEIIVNKVVFQNKASAYTVFQGTVLRWAPRKKEFLPTKEIHTFVGYFFCIFAGDKFSVEADEVFNKTYGTQYVVSSSHRVEPASAMEIRSFLQKNIKGMTPKRVQKVMDKYGLDAIHALRKDANAYDFLGLAQAELDEIRTALIQNVAFEDTMTYLQIHNMDCRYALPLHQKYGDSAVMTITDNPYAPYADDIYGFNVADKLFFALSHIPNSPKRCLYATLSTLRADAENNGNIFTRRKNLRVKMMEILTETADKKSEENFPFTDEDLDTAIVALESAGYIISETTSGEQHLYLRSNYYDERNIAVCLQGLLNEPKRIAYHPFAVSTFLTQYEVRTGLALAPAQKKAVEAALKGHVSIISGGPGTGKTQTINAIVSAIRTLSPDASIRACAPTGKAAIRLSEMTGIPATTIHRALGLGQYTGALKCGDLVCDFMFVDEFSMTDIQLCAKLFDAINPCCRVVMIGDYNQLPSVGPGLVLRDFIASGAIPTTILKQVFRQKGGSRIIENAHRIINHVSGQSINLRIAQKPHEDFYFIQSEDSREILALIKHSIAKIKKDYGYGVDAVQVLSPVHFGDLGVENLNHELQKVLNSKQSALSVTFEDEEFRLGDKVTHIRNDYDLDVFNGEVGFISEIGYTKERMLKVTYPDRDVWYPLPALAELGLAYALTVHKLQGSEYPVIIMPVHQLQGRGLSKNLIYTALTRAKKMVIIIGSPEALSTGLRRETTIERESNLVRRIQALIPPPPHK